MNIAVHPVALFNISDYLTRAKHALDVDHKNIVGGLLGVIDESDQNASIMYSFEIPDDHGLEKLIERLKLFKIIYPYLKLVGLYKVGTKHSLDDHINELTHELTNIEDFGDLVSTQSLLLLTLNESFLNHNFDPESHQQEQPIAYSSGYLPFTVSMLHSKSSSHITDLKIKTLKIEKVALNTINQATQEMETMEDPYSELTRNSKTSLEIMEDKVSLLLLKLKEIKNGNTSGSPEETDLLLQKTGDLIAKLDTIKQSPLEDGTVPLSLINQSLLLNNLFKLSIINKSTVRLSTTPGSGYPFR